MRRLLSIVLVALFYAGPLSALVPGSSQTSLPACCRRHGAHHCMMAMSADSPSSAPASSAPAFTAPARCPLFHRSGPATTASFAPAVQPVLTHLAQRSPALAALRIALLHRARTHSGRGPPILL